MIKQSFLFGLLIDFFSCSSSEGEENFEQLKNIEIGMDINRVNSIMTNDPINLEAAYWSDTLLVESYQSSFGVSDHYKIIYSKPDSTVVEIMWGD